jgi:hypothetical protein
VVTKPERARRSAIERSTGGDPAVASAVTFSTRNGLALEDERPNLGAHVATTSWHPPHV